MRLTSVTLAYIRNHQERSWTFEPEIVVIHGENGVGKTNLLESIYISTIGRSHRTSDLKDLLQWNHGEGGITIDFIKKDTPQKIHLRLFQQGGKEILLNGEKITQKELIGHLNTVIFSPEDLQLVKGTPSQRRRFLDVELSQTNPNYYHQLQQYTRAIQQRNRILKEYAYKRKPPVAEWDEQIATMGEYLITKRLEGLKKLNVLMDLMNRKLTDGREDLTLKYFQPYSENKLIYKKDDLLEALTNQLEEDCRRCSTSVGPHRDDLLFYSGSMNLKQFGSQGQQRTAVLSLKLSELEFIKSEVGEYPILLLDDVFSELDQQRRMNLLKFIHKRIQTFITTTDLEDTKELQSVQYVKMERS